jgi:hypothetical protein
MQGQDRHGGASGVAADFGYVVGDADPWLVMAGLLEDIFEQF